MNWENVLKFVLVQFGLGLIVSFFMLLSIDVCNTREQNDPQKECAAKCRPFGAEVVRGQCFCYDATGALHPKETTP